MAGSQQYQTIPTQLDTQQFEKFVLPHLSIGHRGPKLKLSLHTIFNYILKLLYMGCQWKELPIDKDSKGRPEIHYTRIYPILRRWEADGCIDAIFKGSVLKLHLSSTVMARQRQPKRAATTLALMATRK